MEKPSHNQWNSSPQDATTPLHSIRISSYCALNGCVGVGELASTTGQSKEIAVVDAPYTEGDPMLSFSKKAWAEFIGAVAAGEFKR